MIIARASRAVVLGLGLGAGCARPSPPSSIAPPFAAAPPPSFVDPSRAAKLASAAPKLDAYFADFFAKSRAPSVAVGLLVDGQLAWSKAYGVQDLAARVPATEDSVYRIGSITKTFTATAVMMLRDEGKLALDAPAMEMIPALADVVYPTRDAPIVTLRHMLLHTSGLPEVDDVIGDVTHAPSEADLVRAATRGPLGFAPGTSWSYSGVAYGLLGAAVARASGVSCRDFVTARILRPLGMTSSGWDVDAPSARSTTGYAPKADGSLAPAPPWRFGAMDPAGGLSSTVRDMARWIALQLDAWPPRSDPETGPVRRATLREMHVLQGAEGVTLAEEEPRATVDGYGFSWRTAIGCLLGMSVGHSGGTEGHSSLVFAFPNHNVGFVILTNMRDVSFRGLRLDVWRILRSTGGLEPRVVAGAAGRDPHCE